jgi:hypothetical protein
MNFTLGSVCPWFSSNIKGRWPKEGTTTELERGAGEAKTGAEVVEAATTGRVWEASPRIAAPAIANKTTAGRMRLHSRPVPNPRRFSLTSSSEIFKSGGEE